MKQTRELAIAIAIAMAVAWAVGARAHEVDGTSDAGRPASSETMHPVTVTIVEHADGTMGFDPSALHVDDDQTVRFVIHNSGKAEHEFRIDTVAANRQHKAMMAEMPGMMHHENNSVTVPAGATRTLPWRFTKPGTFEIACLIPGHYEAGMHATVTVGR